MNATRVAARRNAGRRDTAVTLAVLAKRANVAIRFGAIAALIGTVMPRLRTVFNRSSARTNDGPLTIPGPVRKVSSKELRAPSGTRSRSSRRLCWDGLMPLANTRHTRASTLCRSLATKRSSCVAPGNSTLCASIQVVARSNNTLGRSVPVQHCAYSQRVRQNPAVRSVKSRYP